MEPPERYVVLPTRKTQALLAYLAVPPGRAHSRESLAALLWGDLPQPQARASVRVALYRLRKAIPSAVRSLSIDGETVALRAGAVAVDAAVFEQLCAEGTPAALEKAVELYRGDLLAGLSVPEAPFEEWLMVQRERLREMALHALARLLTHQRETGATEAAIATALRLLALDPAREPVHRILMRLYAGLGRRGAALRQYQLCLNALRREFRAAPAPETQRLFEEIVRQRPVESEIDERSESSAPIAIGSPAAPPRRETLASLTLAFEDVAASQGRLMATARRHLRRAVLFARTARREAARAELAAAIALFQSMDMAGWLQRAESLKDWWLG
jgi:DNA-binding SARP family transcriptional activator